MSFKIATWNVNSLRVRLPHVLRWLAEEKPTVIALQEIKTLECDFLLPELEPLGYHLVYNGQKTYNGVAFLSREKHTDVIKDIHGFEDPQRRVLGITIDDIRIINLYVPNGEAIISDKYQYKLTWLKHLNNMLQAELKKYSKLIILGDFNIAPEDDDVHDPELWQGRILCSDPERAAFKNMLQLGLQDCFRLHSPAEKSFTWWDYRLNSFKRDLGMRIDHIIASSKLAAQCNRCYIDKTPRGWERPSDHTVVIAEFNSR